MSTEEGPTNDVAVLISTNARPNDIENTASSSKMATVDLQYLSDTDAEDMEKC